MEPHNGPEMESLSVTKTDFLFQDQRSVNQQSVTQNVMYDQRSLHQHLSVGMDPNVAASAIAHAKVVESQASQMVSQVQQQAGQ